MDELFITEVYKDAQGVHLDELLHHSRSALYLCI